MEQWLDHEKFGASASGIGTREKLEQKQEFIGIVTKSNCDIPHRNELFKCKVLVFFLTDSKKTPQPV